MPVQQKMLVVFEQATTHLACDFSNAIWLPTPIVAINGGVLLNIVGLAASLYRRGVPYIKIPTNLMALIDAGLGVKTGINVIDRRNRLGKLATTPLLDHAVVAARS